MTNNEKLKELKEKYRVSFRDISRVCDYSDTSIYEWVNNKRDLPSDKLAMIQQAIEKKYSIN